MARLYLPQVTLCAVDTRCPALAALSLLRSMSQVNFGRVMLFTHGWVPRRVLPDIELIDIDPIHSGAEYSAFVVRQLPPYIRSSHVLITQWDGFVLDAGAWRDEFLVHDYIGAVWADQPEGLNVGNGGFSLRSRHFLAAGRDHRIEPLHPEDEVLCRTHRAWLEQHHGVRFAPAAVAQHFAFENVAPGSPTFGFHGPYHLPRVLPEDELAQWLRVMPDDFFRGRDARRLARALLLHNMPATAQMVVQRRLAVGRSEPGTRLIGAAASIFSRFA